MSVITPSYQFYQFHHYFLSHQYTSEIFFPNLVQPSHAMQLSDSQVFQLATELKFLVKSELLYT